ncbi:hypothetical protein WJX84_008848 [Apatococcus fuscideae]|uniref:Uncharacterized protein n=1 Tax=Apatococcus fuscideae TaxID=2026836 RepID=A0AAW1TG23_9CHLO
MKTEVLPCCSTCLDVLGKYGGPVTLPCGHNGCLQCMASIQQRKAECPLCRRPFPASECQLVVNYELRQLLTLAAALGTIEHENGWQAVTANQAVPAHPSDLDEEGMEGPALVPTAPPMHLTLSGVLGGGGDLLSCEAPAWLPDSYAPSCGHCRAPFIAMRRMRHHCRLCGQIFCHRCSSQRLLLPPKFQTKQPERVCDTCASTLKPLQPFLAGTISEAVRPAVHDVTDASVLRSWVNNPFSTSLAADIYKATNIVRSWATVGSLRPEKAIPPAVLHGAAGFAILSVAKVGMGWSGAFGTGLVVARRADGSWSAPSSLSLWGLGWGIQFGGALQDLLLVLKTRSAVQAFCGSVHVGVGGSTGLAVGPLGRQADANLRASSAAASLCYSYSCSCGIYAGVSIEGSVVSVRNSVNTDFYGRPITARQLLLADDITPPAAAVPLFAALTDLLASPSLPPQTPPALERDPPPQSIYVEEELETEEAGATSDDDAQPAHGQQEPSQRQSQPSAAEPHAGFSYARSSFVDDDPDDISGMGLFDE